MRCIVALGDSTRVRPEADTTGTVRLAVRADAAGKEGYVTDTTTVPNVAPDEADRTFPVTDASAPPETTVNTVRGSVPMGVTAPFAYVIDAESVQDVATPTPGADAAEVDAARRDAEHEMVVDTGEGSVTLTVPPPGVATTAQLAGTGALMLTTSAEDDEKLLAPAATARL